MASHVTLYSAGTGQKSSSAAALLAFLIFHLFLLVNPAMRDAQAQSIPAEITVSPRVNTGAVAGDADDPAIWIHPSDPALSLVIGTDKVGDFLYVWDLNGQELQRIPIPEYPNNVDVRSGMLVGGEMIDICAVNADKPARILVFKIDPNTRTLIDITTPGGILTPDLKNPYGFALYRRKRDGAMFVFENARGGTLGVIHLYQLMDDGAGKVKGVFVRLFGADVNTNHSEGLVADDELGYLYSCEEDCCIHKFYADPDMGNTHLAAFAYTDGIEPDREGLGIYGCADGTGYLLMSSQGNKRVMVYRREGDPGNPHSHTLVTTIYTPAVGGTDGIDVTSHPAGPNFPNGFLAKHNSGPKNFALIAWEDIAKDYLTTCSIKADFEANVTSGCAPATVIFSDLSSGPVTARNWNFGDGTTSTEPNPSHTYTTEGTFSVTLTVTNDAGFNTTKTRTDYITIGLAPIAAFVATPDSGYIPLSVAFTDQSTGGGTPASRLWDFGDGATSIEQNPTHQYSGPGNYTVALTVSNSCGTHTETKPDYVVAVVPVTADFSADTTIGCQPFGVQFTDHSLGAVTSWLWDFGDGTTSTEQHPLHTYTQAGVYTVSLTASLPGGTDTKTKTDYLTVRAVSTIGFVATPTMANVPTMVSFTNQSTGAPTSWAWDFGDGATSTEQNPTHQYATPGTYAVSLTLTSACDTLTETKPNYIVVVDTVSAKFVADVTAGCAPAAVQFTDQSTGPIVSWSWDFGDGATSTEQNPAHTYAAAGNYTVKLTVTNSLGYSSIATKNDYLVIGAQPIVEFTATPVSGSNPLTVVFTDQSTATPSPTVWLWEFGDDSTSTAQNPTHKYKLPGDYTVQLTVTNACGSVSEIKTNYIQIVPCTPPAPLFSGAPTSGSVPLTVTFTDQSIPQSGTFWNWDFGDGTTSTAQNPTHQYAASGTYAVALTVGSECDTLTATQPNYVVVIDTVSAEFAADVTSGCALVAVQFTDQSTGPVHSWQWDFGDSTTSTEQNPAHTYTGAGNFTVKLTVTNAAGYTSTKTKTAYLAIGALPTVEFVPRSGISGSNPLTVVFTDQSTVIPSATAWLWDFGDGNTSTEQNPTHIYQAVNDYTVTLKVTNACGEASATKTNYVHVLPCTPPAPVFSGTPTSGNVPLTVTFTDQSTGSPAFWNWDFGDGTTSTAQNPTHQYAASGTYAVSLTVGSECDTLTATKSTYVVVVDTVSAEFAADVTSGCAPVAVQFTDQSTGPVHSWQWDFGDSTTSTEQNPAHTYTAAGNHTVKLTVTNSANWQSTAIKNNYLAISALPTVTFAGAPVSGSNPLTVVFTDQSTAVPSPTAWQWDFGDGNNSTAQNPTHIYNVPGNYTVKLTVTNACGSVETTKASYIHVDACTPPAPLFSGSPTSGNVPLTVTFTDQSTGSPVFRNWDFGDGTTSTAPSPAHQYATPGTYTVALTVGSDCDTLTLTKPNYIVVIDTVSAKFMADVTSGCAPVAVQFTDQSTGPVTSWSWDFGDGTNSTEQNPAHTFAAAGNYTVKLTVTNAANWSSNTTKRNYISIQAKPTAAFTGTPTSGYAPFAVTLTNQSTGTPSPASWLWDFGDGNTSTEQNPTHTYNAAGDYTVQLTATNTCGNSTATQTNYVHVNPCIPMAANFSASPTSGNLPLVVNFTDQSTGSPTAWNWDFGDGAVSTQRHPSHQYAATGTYTVKLTVTSACNSDVMTKVNFITVNSVPTGNLALGKLATASSITSPYTPDRAVDGNNTSTYWRSDKVSSTSWLRVDLAAPYNLNRAVVMWKENYYAVRYRLQISTTGGATDSEWTTVYINNNGAAGKQDVTFTSPFAARYFRLYSDEGLKSSNQIYELECYAGAPCIPAAANFSASPSSGNAPFTVNFADQSTGAPTAWSWDFGDGGTSTLRNPSHVYNATGDYTVKLIVSDACGSSTANKVSYIHVNPCLPPVVNFAANITSGNAPFTVNFTDQTPGSQTSWNWNFGDGGTSTQQNPAHTFNAAGDYTVTLNVNGACGPANAAKVNYIHVGPCQPPAVNFTADTTAGNAPFTVKFIDQSTGSPTAWSWNFGDGGTATQKNPSHTFNAAGDYTVTLTVTCACGTTTAGKVNYIHVDPCLPPAANFAASATSGNAPLTVNFTDQSTGGPTAWSWNFGDGSSAAMQQNASHTYNAAGDYTVALTITSICGSTTATKVNYVHVNPCVPATANFSASATSGNAPLTVNFTDHSTGGPNSWSWNFGDGATSTQQNPSHQYTAADTYSVTLTATSSCNSAAATKTNYITVNSVPLGNLALNKLATASSTASPYSPGLAVDGGATTYWRSSTVSGKAPNTWLRVDLGAPYSLNRGVVAWKENYFASVYRFQISNTGGDNDNEWTTVYTNNSGKAGTQNVTLTSPFAARYFRLRMDKNNKGNNQVYELECYAGMAKPIANAESVTATETPKDFALEQNYPNPFNPTTVIGFRLPVESEVTLTIYNSAGQFVRKLADGRFSPGRHEVVWNATDKRGVRVTSGVYVCVLKAGSFVAQRKLVLAK
jgi:PKD repeat protein